MFHRWIWAWLSIIFLFGTDCHGAYKTDEFYFDDESINGTVDCGTFEINGNSSYLLQSKEGMASCEWLFLGTTDCYPVITCRSFYIRPSYYCRKDYLALSDGSADVGLRFCGTYKPYYATSQTSILQVSLNINSDYGAPAFQCKVSCAKHHLNYNGYGYGYNHQQAYPPTFVPTTPPKTTNCDCGVKGSVVGPGSGMASAVGIQLSGGTQVPNGSYRQFVVITGKENSNDGKCVGTLISDRCVLTAASCLFLSATQTFESADSLRVWFNRPDFNNPDNTTFSSDVSKVTPHPLFNDNTNTNDVLILELAQPVKLSAYYGSEPNVTTMCLPPRKTYDLYANKNASILGYDDTFKLAKADVTVTTNEQCAAAWTPLGGQISAGMICAAGASGVGVCFQDHGGPLMTEVYKRYLQIGVSIGAVCNTNSPPPVYTRVTAVNDWIRMTCRKSIWCKELGTYNKYHRLYYDDK
ncbi:Ovochymase-2 [Orchesella cincta]|uniref:Ovochymase-2 n=1 Tax=Orchesella cincta TaxID=48709 RepID=A0A1D2MPB0_ORCCI|nr:Ovochymase-2 [Orchesella cincta]